MDLLNSMEFCDHYQIYSISKGSSRICQIENVILSMLGSAVHVWAWADSTIAFLLLDKSCNHYIKEQILELAFEILSIKSNPFIIHNTLSLCLTTIAVRVSQPLVVEFLTSFSQAAPTCQVI